MAEFRFDSINHLGDRLKGVVTVDNAGLEIHIEGYGDKSSVDSAGEPVYLEMYEGNLVLRAWADINNEDPTHTISMEGARIDRRKEL